MPTSGNGLGFNQYAARYMAKVVTAGGSTPGVLVRQAIETLAAEFWIRFNVATAIGPPLAVYPFYGGTADSHAINLYGDAFTIEWQDTVTHNVNGITGDGVAGLGRTGINPARDLTVTDFSFGMYSRTNAAADVYDIGVNTGTASMYIRSRMVAGTFVSAAGGVGASMSVAVAASTGLFMARRNETNLGVAFRNGAVVDSTAVAVSSNPNATGVAVCAAAGSGGLSTRNIAFAFVARDFGNQFLALYNAVQAYETALGREV